MMICQRSAKTNWGGPPQLSVGSFENYVQLKNSHYLTSTTQVLVHCYPLRCNTTKGRLACPANILGLSSQSEGKETKVIETVLQSVPGLQ
jgi:hypothetical protein